MPTDEKPYPPFITERSPSVARGREEYLHPTPSGGAQAVAVLAQLSEAEDNARQICLRVADELTDPGRATEVRDQAAMHGAKCEGLAARIDDLGGVAPRPNERRGILAHGPESVVRGESDTATEAALTRMGEELRDQYSTALACAELDEALRSLVTSFAPAAPGSS
jgi:hypothetical protein